MDTAAKSSSGGRYMAFYVHVAIYLLANFGLVIIFGPDFWWWVPVVWGVTLVSYTLWLLREEEHEGWDPELREEQEAHRRAVEVDTDQIWSLGGV